jgi:hypothetical protein
LERISERKDGSASALGVFNCVARKAIAGSAPVGSLEVALAMLKIAFSAITGKLP